MKNRNRKNSNRSGGKASADGAQRADADADKPTSSAAEAPTSGCYAAWSIWRPGVLTDTGCAESYAKECAGATDCAHKALIFLLGLLLRVVAFSYLEPFLAGSPEYVTPWNSFKRLREGISLYDSGAADPYDGDSFHVVPLVVLFYRYLVGSPLLLKAHFIALDLLTAFFASGFAQYYITTNAPEQSAKAARMSNIAAAVYLLNPMTIGCCTVMSLSSLVNFFLTASLYFAVRGKCMIPAALLLALAAQLNIYYALLIAPLVIRFQRRALFSIVVSIGALVAFYAANFAFGEPQKILASTVGFLLRVPDLSPNVGIFWYFFVQIFEHYRTFFLFVFQLNTIVHFVPVSATLRKNPYVLWVALLMLVAVFSPYPSYAEATIYLALFPAFVDLHQFLRFKLIYGGMLCASFTLAPIMWRMWTTTGSGNANFYFAIILVYVVAQIGLMNDLVGAYLRVQVMRNHNIDAEAVKRVKAVRLPLIGQVSNAPASE